MLVQAGDEDETLAEGGRVELTLNLGEIVAILEANEVASLEEYTLQIGPAYQSLVAPTGLDYRVTVRGAFDAGRIRDTYCAREVDRVRDVLPHDDPSFGGRPEATTQEAAPGTGQEPADGGAPPASAFRAGPWVAAGIVVAVGALMAAVLVALVRRRKR